MVLFTPLSGGGGRASSRSPLHVLAAQHSRLQPWNWLEHTVTSRLHLLEIASKTPASYPPHSYSVLFWSLHRAVRELPSVFAYICPPLYSRLPESVMHTLIRYWQTCGWFSVWLGISWLQLPYKGPRPGWLKTVETYCLTVLRVGSPRSRSLQGRLLPDCTGESVSVLSLSFWWVAIQCSFSPWSLPSSS